MIYGSISRRYAKALMMLSEEKNVLSLIVRQMEMFYNLWIENKDLQHSLSSPTIPLKIRKGIVLKIAPKLGLHDYVTTFLLLLVEKGRIESLNLIYLTLKSLADKKEGILRGEITSAFPLEQFQVNFIRSSLEKKIGKKVILKEQTDPDLIGGIVVKIEDRVIDGSVKSYLNDVRKSLIGEINQ